MTPLQPSPALDARIAEWMGWEKDSDNPDSPYWLGSDMLTWETHYYGDGHYSTVWEPSVDDSHMACVLDTLVERGYEPALVYDELAGYALALSIVELFDWLSDEPCWLPSVAPDRWQPTRPLSACAAVLALMEESDNAD